MFQIKNVMSDLTWLISMGINLKLDCNTVEIELVINLHFELAFFKVEIFDFRALLFTLVLDSMVVHFVKRS